MNKSVHPSSSETPHEEENKPVGTFDATELAKFDAVADQWWDIHGELKTLHHINPVRLAFIYKYLSTYHSPTFVHKKILDVGCGGGILSESLAREGAIVTGIDASKTVLEVAKQHAKQTGLTIDYQEATVEAMANNHPAAFEIIACMELLEHVPEPQTAIAACAKLLKPGGLVFFSTINRTLRAYGLAIIAAEYLFKWIPKGTHHYEKFIQPAELDSWARSAGLERIALSGMDYNPIAKQAKLSQNVAVNFLACYQRP